MMDLRLQAYLQHLLETAHQVGSASGGNNEAISQALADKMVQDLQIQLEQRLIAALLDKLSLSDQQAYTELVESEPTQAEVVAFLNKTIPGADAIVAATLQQFEQDYVETVNYGNK